MDTKITFECEDRYEAEKLAGLLSVQKDNSIFVEGIAAIISNEIIITLKDKSAHSVIMKDRENAEKLKVVVNDIISGKSSIIESNTYSSQIEIGLQINK